MAGRRHARELHRLATLHGVQLAYYDARGDRKTSSPESLLAVLQALGVDVASFADVPATLAQVERHLWNTRLEPVVVCWATEPAWTDLRLPAAMQNATIQCELRFEDGLHRTWSVDLAQIAVLQAASVDGASYVTKRFPLPDGLAWGYHELILRFDDGEATARVICAPRHAFTGVRGERPYAWGNFLPLYAVHTADGMGSGTYGDLKTLVDWTREYGGDMFGTLPLLATFLSEPFEPSPYSPVSRRFWNEFFLDFGQIPELDASPTARAMLLSGEFEAEVDRLRREELVDYQRSAALRRRVLAELSKTLLSESGQRLGDFQTWVEQNPLAVEYARFMATADQQRTTWEKWPVRQREGTLEEGDFDPDDAHYHLYVQWLAQEQLARVSGDNGAGGSGLYLDLPLGVHGGGFDVWRERDAFAVSARVGAPPDLLNSNGQDWGFPPMHPERVRRDGYDYFVQCVRHHLLHAGALRVDHVMGLHRLYWIPADATPREGVYVRYRHEELYAILTLESHRSKTLIIGEDLGTVPREVRAAMSRHRLQRMWVFPFQIGEENEPALHNIDAGSLASLNTHDLLPFARQWAELDEETRQRIASFLHERGWLEVATDDVQTVAGGLLRYMGDSPARMVLVNLEDLWLETERQNVPGTIAEHPNWRRKARYDLEAFIRMPKVTDALRELDLLRKRGR